MPQITANGIAIEVERFGAEGGVPLLLIRGLGSQIIHWPEDLIAGFAGAGYRVITFDNRDAGLSQTFENGPDYDISEMARDAVGVLDALGVGAAHIFGISMGGMIAQEIIWSDPARALSATIVMSSSGAADLPGRSPEVEALLLAGPAADASREEVIDATLHADRVWAGPGFPFAEAERRALIGRAFDRAWRPDGVARQYRAIMASVGRAGRLAEIDTPTLVVHGADDVLTTVEHGRDIAERIPGAEFVVVDGMGHDIDAGAAAPVLDAFHRFQARIGAA